jgi:hypothetical protein
LILIFKNSHINEADKMPVFCSQCPVLWALVGLIPCFALFLLFVEESFISETTPAWLRKW